MLLYKNLIYPLNAILLISFLIIIIHPTYVLVTLNTYISRESYKHMENTEKWKFEYRGPFAACEFDVMESHIAQCGRGSWKIATVAETLKYSPIGEDAICWTSTKNLWTPDGILVFDDPAGDMPKDEKSLRELYGEGNPAVRYVKRGFKDGEMSISDFVKNPLVIAQVGNADLMDLVSQRANAISKEKSYILNDYLNGKKPSSLKSTALDSFGLCGQFMHMYCSVGQSSNIGRIYGYMRKLN